MPLRSDRFNLHLETPLFFTLNRCMLTYLTSFWHPAKSDDVVFVVNYISNLFGNSARIFLVGYSAGSNIVQKALLHCRRQEEECAGQNDGTRLLSPRIWGATCVCITYDYMAARQRLERSPVGAVYSMLMAHIYKVYFPTRLRFTATSLIALLLTASPSFTRMPKCII